MSSSFGLRTEVLRVKRIWVFVVFWIEVESSHIDEGDCSFGDRHTRMSWQFVIFSSIPLVDYTYGCHLTFSVTILPLRC